MSGDPVCRSGEAAFNLLGDVQGQGDQVTCHQCSALQEQGQCCKKP